MAQLAVIPFINLLGVGLKQNYFQIFIIKINIAEYPIFTGGFIP